MPPLLLARAQKPRRLAALPPRVRHPRARPFTACLTAWASAVALAVLIAPPPRARATTLIVPDQVGTIQGAMNALPDTVLVRPGNYPEVLRGVYRYMRLSRWAPEGGNERPIVGGYQAGAGVPTVEGFVFTGDVSWVQTSVHSPATFINCEFRSGFSSVGITTTPLRLSHCTIRDSAQLTGGWVILDSCMVDGRVRIGADGLAEVRGSTLTGTGGTAVFGAAGRVEITGNRIVGFDRGIDVGRGDGPVLISNNTISGCTGMAIRANSSSGLTVRENTITDCGGGIVLDAYSPLDVSRNRVERVGGTGIAITAEGAQVEENVVLACSGDGIRISSSGDVRVTGNVVGRSTGHGIWLTSYRQSTTRNTSYLNGGSGFVLGSEGASVAWNIAYRNGGSGLVLASPIEPACNVWFENAFGPTNSPIPSRSDIFLDPEFCDVANDDVRLRTGSPALGAATCGRIGALGEGCEVPPPAVASFSSTRVPEGVELRWQIPDVPSGFLAWSERAEGAGGPWSRVDGERWYEGQVTVELDREVAPGRTYWYQLVTSWSGEVRALVAPIQVTTPAGPRFVLSLPGLSLSPGSLEVEFELERDASIEIELFDIQGRRSATIARGTWTQGRHRVTWTETTSGSAIESGVYLVRYRYPGGQQSRRIVFVR